jgi:rhodanese-related sulfurtransferase
MIQRGTWHRERDVNHLTPRELQAWMAERKTFRLLDVRQPEEHAIARLPGSVLMPMSDLAARCTEIDPEVDTVVYCHHGIRSMRAVAFLEGRGLERLFNLRGGIDAWSVEIDPKVPRYS